MVFTRKLHLSSRREKVAAEERFSVRLRGRAMWGGGAQLSMVLKTANVRTSPEKLA